MPVEIELTETSPGQWEVTQRLSKGEHLPPDPQPDDAAAKPKAEKPWEYTVDNIPTVGTPVDFFALVFCLWVLSLLA